MDRTPVVLIGGTEEEPSPPSPRSRLPLGLIGLLLAAGAVWALLEYSPKTDVVELVREIPEPFPTTTVYRSALEVGGGEVLLPGSGMLTDIAGNLALVTNPWNRSGSQLWRIDRQTWSYLGSTGLEGVQVADLAQLPSGRYVAAGVRREADHLSTPAVLVSDDEGESWINAAGLPAGGGTYRLKEFGGQLVLLGWTGAESFFGADSVAGAVRARPQIWVSGDGLTWTKADWEDTGPGRFDDVVETEGGVLVMGGATKGEARLWLSPDLGLSWELVEAPGTRWPVGATFVSLTVEPGRGVIALSAGGTGGNTYVWRSRNLRVWSRDESASPPGGVWIHRGSGGEVLLGVSESRWIGVERPSILFTSLDAASWESLADFPAWEGVSGVAEVDGRLVVMGTAGGQPRAWIWPQASVTVEVPSPPTNRWVEMMAIQAPSGDWTMANVGLGSMLRAGPNWYWSDDGRTWDKAEFADDARSPSWIASSAVAGSGLVVAGGDNHGRSSVWWSTDGRSWSVTEVSERQSWIVGIYQLDGDWITAVHGDGENRLWVSPDGRSWERSETIWPGFDTIIPTDTGLLGMSWSGSWEAYFSGDGMSWNEVETLDIGSLNYIFDSPLGLIGVAQPDLLLISDDLARTTTIEVPSEYQGFEIIAATDAGIALRGYDSPNLVYTEDLVNWMEAPISLAGGFTGSDLLVLGGEGLLVAGYDSGQVKVWKWVP